MRILVITNDFPYKQSNKFVFVKQLVDKWVSMGIKCVVISPQSITHNILVKKKFRPYKYKKDYLLYSPKYFTFGNIPILGKLGRIFFNRVVLKTIKKEKLKFDLVYAHFLIPSGICAYYCFKKLKYPYFIAFGESKFQFEKFYHKKLINNAFKYCSGFIAVSSEIKSRLLSLPYVLLDEKIGVFPNGIDSNKFYKMDKEKIRHELGFNTKDFIVIFVGAFIERKGVLRLDQALIELNNDNIKVIYIGSGEQEPKYKDIIFKGQVKHQKIVKYLNASDIFVLPTTNEGCCNAIIEALACGLPVISSNQSFNDDILNDKYSIRINPNNVDEIKKAINKIYINQDLRIQMSHEALIASNNFNLDKRAQNIIKFIKMKIK